jgi:ABC-type nickel/cobalt efflux system permease component RcnA
MKPRKYASIVVAVMIAVVCVVIIISALFGLSKLIILYVPVLTEVLPIIAAVVIIALAAITIYERIKRKPK